MPEKAENTIQLIDIDLDQWRREVNTFATTTQRALDAIADELSNACNGGHALASQKTTKNASAIKETTSKLATNGVSKTNASKTKPAASSQSSVGNDRLANIKEKLALRLAKAKC